jgi:Abnormal spindle-like microcephaly-assoc'd, ASPM-SPD-2-Hydin
VTGADAGSFPLGGDTCTGQTLVTGQSCTVQVRFRPLGVGAKTAALRFSDSAIDSPQTVALSGTGTPSPWLERSVQGLKFGHIAVGATSPAKTVTLTNVGSAPMTIKGIAKEGANPTDFRNLTQTCTAIGTLNPGQSCTASIAFRPTATGPRSATLTITDSAPRNPHHVALSGTGT